MEGEARVGFDLLAGFSKVDSFASSLTGSPETGPKGAGLPAVSSPPS